MATSIKDLTIYQDSLRLEDELHTLTAELFSVGNFDLANDLRRTSTAVSHYVSEYYKRYNYTMKMQALHEARVEAEQTVRHLQEVEELASQDHSELKEGYRSIVKASWGLIKELQYKRNEALKTRA